MNKSNEEKINFETIEKVEVEYKYGNKNDGVSRFSITSRSKTYHLCDYDIERLDRANQKLFDELCSANALETLVGQELFCKVFKNKEGEICR